jgi:hypothetical protein
MLKPGASALGIAIAVAAGFAALVVCVAFETGPVVTSVLPVGVGVCALEIARSVLKRRAWQRANAERG